MQNDPYKNAVKHYDKLLQKIMDENRKIGLKMFPPKKGMRILDVGCGTGLSLKNYQAYECEIFGIDLSPSMVEAARTKLGENADIRVGDVSELPYPNNFFDLALTWVTLHEVSPSVRLKAVQEMIRVTKTNGHILLYDFHFGPTSFPKGWMKKAIRFVFEISAGGDHFKNFRHFIANKGLMPLIESCELQIKAEYYDDNVYAIFLVSPA